MATIAKKPLDEDSDSITVYSFAGSVIIPTEQGAYWANAVGGRIESRPIGNPFLLFSLKYIWGLGGEVSELPEPITVRLNTAMAVTETFNFKFPAPEVQADVQAEVPASSPRVEDDLGATVEDYEDGEFGDEDEEGDADEDGDEDLSDMADAWRAENENEMTW